MTATKDDCPTVKQNHGNSGWKERNSEDCLFQLPTQMGKIRLLDQISFGFVWLALNFLDMMYFGDKSFNTSNWLIYTALPIAFQLKAKQNISWGDDPASRTGNIILFCAHCSSVLP